MTHPARARRAALLLAAACVALPLPARAALPVLRANSRALEIRDGDRVLRGVWTADPAIALDVFEAGRGTRGKRVTFVSDLDSLAVDVRPGETHDFVVLLAGGDSCRTRISTQVRSLVRARPGAAGPDTIPFTLERGKVHVRGRLNGSRVLDLIFDTGADRCVLYPSARAKGATLRLDGTVLNTGTGGTELRRTASDNRLEVAGLRWEREPVLLVEKQADRADGIVGWPVFEDKVVQFDWVRRVLVVHDSLPAISAEFHRVPLSAAGSLTAVDLGFRAGAMHASGPLILDTAGNGALFVNDAFATRHGLRGALRRLGSSTSRGIGRATIRNDILRLPELELAGFVLTNVPVHVARPAPGDSAPPGGVICTEVLGRFDTYLDYPHGAAWFRPNARFRDRFRTSSGRGSGGALVAIAAATAIASGLAASRKRTEPDDGRNSGA